MSYVDIIRALDKGNLKQAQEVAMRALVVEEAKATMLDWVNHPERIVAFDLKRQGSVITAIAEYGGEEYPVEVNLENFY
jgi:hypothetical protein